MIDATQTPDLEGWCRGLLIKQAPRASQMLMKIFEALEARGEATTDDITDRDEKTRYVIGAVFKILPNFGIVQTPERRRSMLKINHGHQVWIYKVSEWQRFRAAIRAARGLLLYGIAHQDADEKKGQGRLF